MSRWERLGEVLSMVDLDRLPSIDNSLASLEYLAYERIKEAIITLAIPPRAPIVETQVAEQLGISKTPLRAALLQLERERLVVAIPYKGSRAAPITLKQITDLYQLREAIEVYAVREAVRSFTEADLEALEALLRRQEQAFSAGDHEGANLIDGQFHRYFVDRLKNPLLTEIFRNIADHRRRLRHALARSMSESLLAVSPKHRLRLDAIRAQDAATAERIVVESIRNGLKSATVAELHGVLEGNQLTIDS
jgi:DNA-binding GntR family transcriptional regulator